MSDVTCQMVEVPIGEGVADAVLAHPAHGGPHPAVLLYMDAYGIRPALRAHVSRLANAGYCVLAPNVFHRSGRVPLIENIEERLQSEDRGALFEQLMPMIRLVTPEAANADSECWLGYLRGRSEAAAGPIGTVGYCMGGRLSLRMGGEFADDVAAVATFHGGNMATEEPDSPHLAAVRSTGELYIGHADNDRSMPPEQMGRLSQALAEAHVRHTAELYVGAGHGWTQTDTPVYDEPSAERHWARLLELFGRTLHP
jgi:carboxymethylenebutenolidase